MKKKIRVIFLVAAVAALSSQAQRRFQMPEMSSEQKEFLEKRGSRGIGVHDPSTIVKCKDMYWIFQTGIGTPSYRSKDLKTWEPGPQVLKEKPSWQSETVPKNNGMHYWAPDVICFKGQYLLFFSVSSFGSNTSAIGVTRNKTLDPDDPEYKWSEPELVIKSDRSVNFNAIDPALIADEDGRLWMTFGSFWSGMQLIELDPKTGKRILEDSPIKTLAHYDSIEAPYIYFNDGYYYLFVNWGMCCRGADSTYSIRVGRSKKITGPYLDKEGEDMLTGGGSLLLETDGIFVGPGHAGIWKEGDSYLLGMHYYNAAMRGWSQYALRPLTWDDKGWPVVETP